MSVSQTEMTLLCNFAWKKIGLKRESHPLTTGQKYVAVYCDHRQAKKEVVLGLCQGSGKEVKQSQEGALECGADVSQLLAAYVRVRYWLALTWRALPGCSVL